LKGSKRQNALADLLVANADLEARGLDQRRPLGDQLLENLLLDSELLQELIAHLPPARRSVRLQLGMVDPPEFAGGDFLVVDSRHRVARPRVRAGPTQEIGNV